MAKQHGLGRGLDSLFADPEEWGESVRQIPIGELDPNPDQPRKTFDRGLIEDLAESIRKNGVLTPLLVVPSAGGRYTIIAGERRYRAARMTELETLPCLVREHWSEMEQAEAALVENLQREDLNAIDVARGLQALISHHQYTHEDAGRVVGVHRTSVTNLLRLLELPEEVLAMVQSGQLSAGHARALLGLKEDGADAPRAQEIAAAQTALARRIAAEGLSVRKVESLVAESRKGPAKPERKPKKELASELVELQEKLRLKTGMKSELKGSISKGSITLRYHSREELERLNEMLDLMRE